MQNISAFGFLATVKASATFPSGFQITHWSDDSDPFDVANTDIADNASAINGQLVHWSKTNAIPLTLNVIPDSDDDRNLAILYEANRVAKDKRSASDIIDIAVQYPDGRVVTFSPGIIKTGTPSTGVSSAGRRKTKSYSFVFENKTGL